MNTTSFSLAIFICLTLQGQVMAAQNETAGDSDSVTTDTPVTPDATRSIEEYDALIKIEQGQNGPFDPQLSEQLLGLGLLYKTQGQYDEAAKVLERALHIKRVTEGVENLTQLPVLNALIDVNTAAGNWKDLDRNYDLLLQVNQRNLSSGDLSVLTDIERVGHWKLLAYNQNLLKKKGSSLLSDMIKVYKSTIKIIEKSRGENDPLLIEPLNNLTLAHYYMQSDINYRPLGDFQGSGGRDRLVRVCRLTQTRQGVIQICSMEPVSDPTYYLSRQMDKDISLRSQSDSMRNSLNRIIGIVKNNPALAPHELAMALVNIGDWYLTYNMRDAAIPSYQSAYQLLTESGRTGGDVDKVFGRPARIPSLAGYTDNNDGLAVAEGQPYVKLSLDVDINGKPDNIKIIEEGNTKNFIARESARKRVKSWLFRPRFQNGEPVDTHDMVILLTGEMLRKIPVQQREHAIATGTRIRR